MLVGLHVGEYEAVTRKTIFAPYQEIPTGASHTGVVQLSVGRE